MTPFRIAELVFALFDRFLPDDTKASWGEVKALYGDVLVGLDPEILEAVNAKWQNRMAARAVDPRLSENRDIDEMRRQEWLTRQKGDNL